MLDHLVFINKITWKNWQNDMVILRRFHPRLKCQTGALKMLNWKTEMMLKKQSGRPMPKVFPAIRKNHLYQILILSELPFVKVD